MIMKKATYVLLVLVLVAFTQCKKSSDIEQPQTGKFGIKAEVSVDNSKTDINGLGIINWLSGDKLRFFNGNGITTLNTTINEQNPTMASISGDCLLEYFPETTMYPTNIFRSFLYIGNSFESSGMGSTEVLTLSFSGQTGMREDIGETHYMILENHEGKRQQSTQTSYYYNFDQLQMKSSNAIARFDLSSYEGPVKIHFEYEGVPSQFPMEVRIEEGEKEYSRKGPLLYHFVGAAYSYTEPTVENSFITISDPSADTYVALLPDGNSSVDLVFTDSKGKVGRVTFPNNIKGNYIYTGPNYTPIVVGAKSVVEATEIF